MVGLSGQQVCNGAAHDFINQKDEFIGALVVLEDISTEKRMQGTLARYMTKEVADQLLSDEAGLGGQVKEATVFFSDIRSFTTISETLGAEETVSMLNEYFTDMVDILFKYHGILDKYIGDAIMAVFGTPFATNHDPDNATQASIDMMIKLTEFNTRREKEGKQTLDIGIGLNTAKIVVGNIGSEKRMDYTVIGDGVNLASRLEGANKIYGSNILISEYTKNSLQMDYQLRLADKLQVKGKTKPVSIYEVLDYHDKKSFPHMNEVLDIFHRGQKRYFAADFQGAHDIFDEALKLHPRDRLAQVYLQRCKHFLEEHPGKDWDGIWVMTTK